MPKPKKTYRTIKDSPLTGRFTREEIRAALLAAKLEIEAEERAARADARRRRKSGAADAAA